MTHANMNVERLQRLVQILRGLPEESFNISARWLVNLGLKEHNCE